MSISAIKINNLLSFDQLELNNIKDINCIVGKNNVGKSNLLKALSYFYKKLEGINLLPPRLNSNYSVKGSISLTFDTTRIFNIAKKNSNNSYFQFIMRKLIPIHRRGFYSLSSYSEEPTEYTLTLYIYSNNAVKWSTNDYQTRNLILYLFPFFYIEPRHMNLHEWDDLWDLVARIKSFNLSKIDNDSVVKFFDEIINTKGDGSYKKYITELNNVMPTKKSTQKEKILSYIRAGLDGYKFEINDSELEYQSDGTNSFHFIKVFLHILITISKREYITPFVFIDEPELGLHPKMNEILIQNIYRYYNYNEELVHKTIQPKIYFSTHSPNIVKEIIKKFKNHQAIFAFKKHSNTATVVTRLNSEYDSDSFINIFSDNEARLFFSNFILFVEGETELEIFGNMKLSKHFPQLEKIDIYKSSSNVIGERVNPSYSNSAIPYLFIFDADKAWDLAETKGVYRINLKKNGNYFNLKKIDLEPERNKYLLGYNFKHQSIGRNISTIISLENSTVEVDLTNQKFIDKNTPIKIHYTLNKYLHTKNIYINKTTFEGCLINTHSSDIFYAWLMHKHKIDITTIKKRISRSKYIDESMLIDYLRLIFNGKTEILHDYSHLNITPYKEAIRKKQALKGKLLKSSVHAKKIMFLLEEKTLKNSSETKTGKTSGWATSFVDFAISYIEQESSQKNEPFLKLFNVYFPEFSDILSRLQPDS
ncbi:retron Eco8 family effector endonuclease [Aeromonas veronii]|uniref:retron Eco8 family effector endonuclease n=1 Tax=Aeromonas veronii TaxID=654 RepID=UPI00342259EC